MKCLECADDRLEGAECRVCLGTGVAAYIPIPTDPWNEIADGLYQGSAMHRVDDQFHAVYTLCSIRDSGPSYGIKHRRLHIPDGALAASELQQVVGLANLVAFDLDVGLRVLVRCRAGLNRSGLVVAIALLQRGRDVDEILKLERAHRSPWALCNPHFVDYLRYVAA
jgi:hypothetical protein